MDDLDYFTLKELKNSIEESVRELEKEIIDYSARANDEEFGAMVRKAIYYREIIKRIDEQLNA
ncbi:MAG: hypothetical protein U5M51_04490 [Emticicia sp.]|nr:hypothetical protein [Emticicia sp.]